MCLSNFSSYSSLLRPPGSNADESQMERPLKQPGAPQPIEEETTQLAHLVALS